MRFRKVPPLDPCGVLWIGWVVGLFVVVHVGNAISGQPCMFAIWDMI